MAYKNLEQILALSKTSTRDAGVEIPPFPKLNGKLAAIDPQGVEQFNAAVTEWVQQFAVKARQQEFEQNLSAQAFASVAAEQPVDVVAPVAPVVAPAAPSPASAAPASPVSYNVTIGAGLDPNGVVVGSVKDLYKSAVSLGGDGSFWVKTSGTATSAGWE